jgi:hypothetical protein
LSDTAFPTPIEHQTRGVSFDAAVAPVKPRLFQAATLSVNQRNLVPYLLEALKHGNLEQQQRAMEIVISLSDCRSNQNFLVDFGIAHAIGQLGVKSFSPTAVKSLLALLQFNSDAVQTARSQGVADSISRIVSSLSKENVSLLPEIAELNAILG